MVASVQAQIQTRDREKKLSVLTNKELSSLAPETVTYKSVGKMYVVVVVVVVAFRTREVPPFGRAPQLAEHAYDTSNIQNNSLVWSFFFPPFTTGLCRSHCQNSRASSLTG